MHAWELLQSSKKYIDAHTVILSYPCHNFCFDAKIENTSPVCVIVFSALSILGPVHMSPVCQEAYVSACMKYFCVSLYITFLSHLIHSAPAGQQYVNM